MRSFISKMNMSKDQKTIKGYAVTDAKKWSEFKLIEFPSKKWEETDVEIAITHCGVCGSDVHTLTSGWGDLEVPMVAGHEIAGTVTRVGSQVQDKSIKVGSRAGVGAQIGSDYTCQACKSGNENYCPNQIATYAGKYPDGVRTQGGYSNMIIANERYVFPIPDGIESKYVASMLCAGLTVYAPLKRHGTGPGKKVGIVGIGGLGHYAVLFAKALEATVYAFSHDKSKEKDVKEMGADHVIDTSKKGFAENMKGELDFILSTRDVADNFPLAEYLSMLRIHGQFITVGLPDHPLPPIEPFTFASNGALFGASHIGSKREAMEMLDLAAKKGIKPWIEELPMKDVQKAVEGVKNNKVRYRYVLTQDIDSA